MKGLKHQRRQSRAAQQEALEERQKQIKHFGPKQIDPMSPRVVTIVGDSPRLRLFSHGRTRLYSHGTTSLALTKSTTDGSLAQSSELLDRVASDQPATVGPLSGLRLIYEYRQSEMAFVRHAWQEQAQLQVGAAFDANPQKAAKLYGSREPLNPKQLQDETTQIRRQLKIVESKLEDKGLPRTERKTLMYETETLNSRLQEPKTRQMLEPKYFIRFLVSIGCVKNEELLHRVYLIFAHHRHISSEAMRRLANGEHRIPYSQFLQSVSVLLSPWDNTVRQKMVFNFYDLDRLGSLSRGELYRGLRYSPEFYRMKDQEAKRFKILHIVNDSWKWLNQRDDPEDWLEISGIRGISVRGFIKASLRHPEITSVFDLGGRPGCMPDISSYGLKPEDLKCDDAKWKRPTLEDMEIPEYAEFDEQGSASDESDVYDQIREF